MKIPRYIPAYNANFVIMLLKRSLILITTLPLIGYPIRRIQASPLGFLLARGIFCSITGVVISRGMMLCTTVLVARMLSKVGY